MSGKTTDALLFALLALTATIGWAGIVACAAYLMGFFR